MKIAIIVACLLWVAAGQPGKPLATPKCSVALLTQKILTTRNAAWRPSRRFNEVYPGLVVGEGTNALIHPILRDLKITHVLNCASPSADDMVTLTSRQVEYPEEYEVAFNITVHGLPIHDEGSYQVGPLFQDGADFIEDVLANGGRVYVNSFTGSSRAGTIVVGYFMIKHGLSASDALHLVRLGREVRPEKGFLKQLCDLEAQLQASPTPSSESLASQPSATSAAPVTAAPTTVAPETTTAQAHRKPWEPPRAVAQMLHSFLG